MLHETSSFRFAFPQARAGRGRTEGDGKPGLNRPDTIRFETQKGFSLSPSKREAAGVRFRNGGFVSCARILVLAMMRCDRYEARVILARVYGWLYPPPLCMYPAGDSTRYYDPEWLVKNGIDEAAYHGDLA